MVLLQNRDTEVQTALTGKSNKLLEFFIIVHFYIQPQEGAVHFLTALQASLCPPFCSEKISQEGQVMMKFVSVLLLEHLEISALVYLIKMRLKVLAETHIRVEADDFSRVQLTFTVQVGNKYTFLHMEEAESTHL